MRIRIYARRSTTQHVKLFMNEDPNKCELRDRRAANRGRTIAAARESRQQSDRQLHFGKETGQEEMDLDKFLVKDFEQVDGGVGGPQQALRKMKSLISGA